MPEAMFSKLSLPAATDVASNHQLAVLKAAYDYDPQSEDETPIKEDQLLYLLERTDDE